METVACTQLVMQAIHIAPSPSLRPLLSTPHRSLWISQRSGPATIHTQPLIPPRLPYRVNVASLLFKNRQSEQAKKGRFPPVWWFYNSTPHGLAKRDWSKSQEGLSPGKILPMRRAGRNASLKDAITTRYNARGHDHDVDAGDRHHRVREFLRKKLWKRKTGQFLLLEKRVSSICQHKFMIIAVCRSWIWTLFPSYVCGSSWT